MEDEEKSYDPLDTTLTFVDRKNDLDPVDEDTTSLRAQMSCGHAVTPDVLTDVCRHQLDQGHFKFKCPAVVQEQPTVELCNRVWPYQEVRRLADLSAEEMQYFEETIARLAAAEYCDVQTCPRCGTCVERQDQQNLCVTCTICSSQKQKLFQFCWQCGRRWKGPAPRSDRCNNHGCKNQELRLLRNCRMTNLADVEGIGPVPSVRACPTCGHMVEHDRTGCKNITCPRCQVEFCFSCLKRTPICLQTSSYFTACSDGVAPRQTTIPVWHRTCPQLTAPDCT